MFERFKMPKALPCPFCGRMPLMTKTYNMSRKKTEYYMYCGGGCEKFCTIVRVFSDSRREAVIEWNETVLSM